MSFVFQMIIKLINYWAPYDASDTPTSWGEIPQQCCFLHCMVAVVNGTCNLLRNRNERTSRKQMFFLGHEFPVQTLWVHAMIWRLLKSWGIPKSSMGWGWTIWICLISLLSGVGTCPHSPSPNYWGYIYFFKWCSNSPQKGHLPSSKWNRPCQIYSLED